MDRRRVLAGVVAGLTGAAGCLAGSVPRSGGAGAGGADAGSGRLDLPVSRSELVRAAPVDAIPAVVDPAFAVEWGEIPVTAHDPRVGTYETTVSLRDDDRVIGVERDGRARAYPLKVLNYHEVVNDALGGPLLVTYCPLCRSGITAERTVSGTGTVFGVSGLLWRDNLVLYDRLTDSLWSQIAATAIRGPATGERLELVPSTLTTVGAWRASHPDAEFLLPPPASGTVVGEVSFDYDRDPYAGYDASRQVGVSTREFGDDRLHPKTLVVGVAHGGESRAYPVDAVARAGVVNDRVGGLPVVVAVAGEGSDESADGTDPGRTTGTFAAYVRRVDGRIREFQRADPDHLRAAGSRWSIATGRAVDGPHEGTRLRPASDRSPMYWFAWLDFRPETTVYGL